MDKIVVVVVLLERELLHDTTFLKEWQHTTTFLGQAELLDVMFDQTLYPTCHRTKNAGPTLATKQPNNVVSSKYFPTWGAKQSQKAHSLFIVIDL